MIQLSAADGVADWAQTAYRLLTQPLFTVHDTDFSAATLLKLLIFFLFVAWLGRAVRRFLRHQVFPRLSVEPGPAYALANITFYVIVTCGLFVGLETSGVDLSMLAVLFGALGVGVGFGLQAIVSNFVSGLIILLERPLQVGDRIQLGDLNGQVMRIRMRATEVRTNDNIAVIVPNTQFVTQQVINWSRGGDTLRVGVPVGVAYDSDVKRVRAALMEAAHSVPALLRDPEPQVRLTRFGDSAIEFELLGWTRQMLHRPKAFVSEVNFAILESFQRHEIRIPFPQRDVHLRSATPLPNAAVSSEGPSGESGRGANNLPRGPV